MRIQKIFASLVAAMILGAAHLSANAAATHEFTDKDRQEVKDVFLRQAAAATSHDIVAFEGVLASLVARAYRFWGKPALVAHFKETFKGVWKFEPNVESIKIIPLTADVAQIYAPTQITGGASEASAKTAPFLVYEVAVRTAEGWRIAAIVPVAAQ
jgi:hypothetical protein